MHVVVQLARGEGEPRVVEITDVYSGDDGAVLHPVFSYRNEAGGGHFVATGHVPAWAEGAPGSLFRS